MSKTVKLDDKVHSELEELRGKRETFSEVVARLVDVYRNIQKIFWGSSRQPPGTPGQGA